MHAVALKTFVQQLNTGNISSGARLGVVLKTLYKELSTRLHPGPDFSTVSTYMRFVAALLIEYYSPIASLVVNSWQLLFSVVDSPFLLTFLDLQHFY